MVENPVLSGTIRMEGMQEFCMQTTVMDGEGTSHNQLGGFKFHYFSCFCMLGR